MPSEGLNDLDPRSVRVRCGDGLFDGCCRHIEVHPQRAAAGNRKHEVAFYVLMYNGPVPLDVDHHTGLSEHDDVGGGDSGEQGRRDDISLGEGCALPNLAAAREKLAPGILKDPDQDFTKEFLTVLCERRDHLQIAGANFCTAPPPGAADASPSANASASSALADVAG
jgi:hypothetical protein